MLHNYRSRQVRKTLNGVHPSSSFKDMCSAKSGPNLWQIWQVFGPWASPYRANGQMIMTMHNYRPRKFHRTLNGENPWSRYRNMGSASLAATRPPAWTLTTIPLQPKGLRVKKMISLGTIWPWPLTLKTGSIKNVTITYRSPMLDLQKSYKKLGYHDMNDWYCCLFHY